MPWLRKTRRRGGKAVVIGCDQATLAGRDVLDRVEAEGGHSGQSSDRAAAVRGSNGVARVGDQSHTAVIGELAQLVVIAGLAGIIDRRRWRGCSGVIFDSTQAGSQKQRAGLYVGEHGSSAAIHDSVGGGGEGHRRNDDLVTTLNVERIHGGVQRGGSARNGDGMTCAGEGGDSALEAIDRGAGGEPVRAEDFDDGFDVIFADGLAAVGKRSGAAGGGLRR